MSMCEIFHSFSLRSQCKSVFSLKSHNKVLLIVMAGLLLLTMSVLEITFLVSRQAHATVAIMGYKKGNKE